ncbi:hypothetical protein VNO77_43415 [Canavalia gladiata]|uniref:Uncharacterized protein n=1 Tax=Canavalia gladiata TaxID=3824 RepID=A0AAN9PPF2_CANGL
MDWVTRLGSGPHAFTRHFDDITSLSSSCTVNLGWFFPVLRLILKAESSLIYSCRHILSVVVDRDTTGNAEKMCFLDCSSVSEIHKVIPLLSMPLFMLDKSGPLIYSSFISYSLMLNRHTSFFRVPVLLIHDLCEDG